MAASSPQSFQFGLRGMLLLVALLCAGMGLGIYFAILVVVIYVVYRKFAGGEAQLAFVILVGMLILTLMGVGVFVEIRLDTGDERLTVWGVPVFVHRMRPEPHTALLSIRNPKEPVRWSWCATSEGSNHPNAMVCGMYKSAAVWVKADPAVARVIVRDLGEYLRSTHGMYGLPECSVMLGEPALNWETKYERVSDDWRSDREVQDYLKRKGVDPAKPELRGGG